MTTPKKQRSSLFTATKTKVVRAQKGRPLTTLGELTDRLRDRVSFIAAHIDASTLPYTKARKAALEAAETHFGIGERTLQRDWKFFEPSYRATKQLLREAEEVDRAVARLAIEVTTRK